MNFFSIGEKVCIGRKQGTIVKVLKNKKYRVRLEFEMGIRNWDFKEVNLRKLGGY